LQQPTDNIKQGLRSLYQAIALKQAHLQFMQDSTNVKKLQKSLPFSLSQGYISAV
jgi:hypothetical protein